MAETGTKRDGVSRRAALRRLGAGAGAAVMLPWLSDDGLLAFERLQKAKAAPALKALTPSQYQTMEALAEAIIPTDERSPGAKQARVADYIDLLISESDPIVRKAWTDGLAALDAEASSRHQAPFAKLSADQIDALLTDISRNERETMERQAQVQDPKALAQLQAAQPPLERFFMLAKSATIAGYYTSEIGIHQELHYKGNQYTPEFVGCLTEDGKDCPYCGQKAVS